MYDLYTRDCLIDSSECEGLDCPVCSPSCSTCVGEREDQCTSCYSYENEDGIIVQLERENQDGNTTRCVCPSNTYFNGEACISCPELCESCESDDYCYECVEMENLILEEDNLCHCAENYVFNGEFCEPDISLCPNSDCSLCLEENHCITCDESLDCLTCDTNGSLVDGVCICDYDYFWRDNTCIECDATCGTCEEETEFDCLSCEENARLQDDGTCICRRHFTFDENTG